MKHDTCKHFNGLMNDGCDAGVEYAAVEAPGTGIRTKRLPCFGECAEARCDKREFPTQEELDEWERLINERMQKTVKAREAIVADAGGKRSVSGELPCPCCETGVLRYAIAFNGHVHAACSTEGCVRWME